MSKRRYDPAVDARKSYDDAVAAKKARGDTHWPERLERATDPDTARQMARLKKALERKILRQAQDDGGAPVPRLEGRAEAPFAREKFAAAVRQKLDGVSHRRACEAFPALNPAMISRAKAGKPIDIDTFLTLCATLRLKPLIFWNKGVKRRKVTRKSLLKQTDTARVTRETGESHSC